MKFITKKNHSDYLVGGVFASFLIVPCSAEALAHKIQRRVIDILHPTDIIIVVHVVLFLDSYFYRPFPLILFSIFIFMSFSPLIFMETVVYIGAFSIFCRIILGVIAFNFLTDTDVIL